MERSWIFVVRPAMQPSALHEKSVADSHDDDRLQSRDGPNASLSRAQQRGRRDIQGPRGCANRFIVSRRNNGGFRHRAVAR